MILTDLLLDGATAANKQAFNILCEQVSMSPIPLIDWAGLHP
jgi:hypothetical protein